MSGADDSRPQFVQNVVAVNGFAYGAMGADIHVHGGSGLPLYLLGNWQDGPDTDPQWLRELPSRMLNARRAVVPFTGRQDELADLRQWRDGSGRRLETRWLYGPGGQGKTRLAAQLAAESAEAGWKVVAAFHGPDADPIESGSQDLRLAGAAGVLMIVDYADRWLTTNLTWLLKNALLHQTGVMTRILMLGRTLDALPPLRATLDTYQAGVSSRPLSPLPPGGDARDSMFTSARDGFATAYELDDAAGIQASVPLGEAEFGLTLAVHMAALVAVDAHANGADPPADRAGLTLYLLDREQLHWARLYSDGTHAAQDGTGFRTPPRTMNRAVFTAILTGTLPHTAGTAVLDRLQVSDPAGVLRDHASCYPPSPSTGQVLEPLYPDRLAEDFLALTFPGHRSAYPDQPWAIATASALLARSDRELAPAPWTPRAIVFLASAAQHWGHLGPRYLHPLLLEDPQLAIDAGSSALTVLADLPDAISVLEAVEARFPAGRHTDLDPGMAALTARLTEHRLGLTDDPAEHAVLYGNLGMRQWHAGLHRRALESNERAVACCRGLAEADPARYLPALSGALTDRGVFQSELGQEAEALAATEEAISLARRHDAEYPGADYPDVPRADLPGAMGNLGSRLLAVGRIEDALQASLRAAELYGRLSEADPDTYRPDFARALVNAGILLFQTGDRADAVNTGLAAAEIYRELAAEDPHAYEPAFATSLVTVANHLWGTGRGEAATGAAALAVDIRRRLAETNPDAHRPSLARALTAFGVYLWKTNHPAEALEATEEAVRLWHELAAAHPAVHERHLATALSNLGNRLAAVDRPEQALAATEEAVRIHSGLAATGHPLHQDDLGMALNNLGNRLARLDRPEGAAGASRLAVDIYRRLAAEHPSTYEHSLARALVNLGVRLGQLGRVQEALATTEEGIRIQRALASKDPAAFAGDLEQYVATRDALRSGFAR